MQHYQLFDITLKDNIQCSSVKFRGENSHLVGKN